MADLELGGCRPKPLAGYLKALGVLRVVGAQADTTATAWWNGSRFILRSSLDRDALVDFFAAAYAPTPLVAPWNSGSGFGAKDERSSPKAWQAVCAIEGSTVDRLSSYRATIAATRVLVADDDWETLDKVNRVKLCRSELPDDALAWIDAAVVLTGDDAEFPQLVGTGGNIGRFDLTGNFAGRVGEVLGLVDRKGGQSPSPELLAGALFADRVKADRGGLSQYDGAADVTNPWDFVLLIEGALFFASAPARRMHGDVTAAMPFTMRTAAGGYASAAPNERSRQELWAPLWTAPTTASELREFLAEGRATFRGSQVSTGLNMARAVTSLGTDRGVDRFVRHAFIERNGQAMVAVPVGTWRSSRRVGIGHSADLDGFVARVRRRPNKPASLEAALKRYDDAQFAVASAPTPGAYQLVAAVAVQLVALCQRSSSLADTLPNRFGLSPDWVDLLDDHSIEFEVARAIAANGRIFPHKESVRAQWVSRLATLPVARVVANALVDHANVASNADWPPRPSGPWARHNTAEAFLAGTVDDRRVATLTASLLLLNELPTPSAPRPPAQLIDRPSPPLYALCAPFFVKGAVDRVPPRSWPRLLVANRSRVVASSAMRELRIARRRVLVRHADHLSRDVDPLRLAASLALPISPGAAELLLDQISQPTETTEETSHA